MKKYSSGFLLFFLSLSSVFGLVANDKPEECVWRVGIFEFKVQSEGRVLSNLKSAIPREILDNVHSIAHHFLTKEEKKQLSERTYQKKLVNIKKELSSLYNKRDTLFFSENTNTAEYEKTIHDILEKKTEMKNLESENDNSCTTSTIAVKIISHDNNEELFPLTGNSLESVYSRQDMEQAVYGKLEMVDQWLSLTVYLYNFLTLHKEILYNNVIDPAAVHKILPEVMAAVRMKVSGRELPVLSVNGKPADAFFNLDNGRNYSTGMPVSVFLPGTHKLTIHRNGYISEKQEIVLKQGGNTRISYTLKRKKTGLLSLSTFPSGADIYSGSLWIGKSPYVINDPVFPLYLSLKKKGYNDIDTIVDKEDVSKNMRYFLLPDSIDREKMIKRRRKRFYHSFASFVISLSLPVISYSISSDYGYAYNNVARIDPFGSEAQRLMDSSTLWYNLYLGGVFVSTSLFINMAINLWDYIKLYN